MEHCHPAPEPPAEPAYQLGSEGDLGDQDQGAPPLFETMGDGLKIDFRLAAAGDAPEQERGEPSSVQGRSQPDQRSSLPPVEHQGTIVANGFHPERVPVDFPLRHLHESQFPQPSELN